MRVRGEKLTCKRILRFIKRLIFERAHMLIFERDVNDTPAIIEYKTNVAISQVSDAGLDTLMRGKRPIHKAVILERLNNGDICFVAKKDDRICGYAWVRGISYYFPEVYYKVDADEQSIWIYDELVFEEERGKRIQQQILHEIFGYCKSKGYKKVYVGILSDNDSSLRAHSRFGFKKLVKEIKMLKLLGIKRHKIIYHGDK